MVDKTSQMFVTGPDVIKTVTGEDVGMEELGGALTHNTISGVAHYLASDEDDALDYARTLISASCPTTTSPSSRSTRPTSSSRSPMPTARSTRSSPTRRTSRTTCTTSSRHIVDHGDFLEVQPLFAPNIVIGFARVEGRSVGIIANQPNAMAGTLNIDAGEKASRFVRFCDAFSIPILTLVDVPGYLPGTDQEWTGVIRRGAKLLYAYAEATVPLVTVITRKAYGGAYIVMGSKQLGADINLAWPTAEIAVMGGQGAVNILYRGEIKRAEEAGEDVAAVRTKLANEYTYNVASPVPRRRARRARRRDRAGRRRASPSSKALRALRTKRAQPAAEEAREHPAVGGTMVDDSTAGGAGADEADARADAIRFVTRDVSAEEAAAVTAVLARGARRGRRRSAPVRRSRPQRVGAQRARAAHAVRRRARRLADARVADGSAPSRLYPISAFRPRFRPR